MSVVWVVIGTVWLVWGYRTLRKLQEIQVTFLKYQVYDYHETVKGWKVESYEEGKPTRQTFVGRREVQILLLLLKATCIYSIVAYFYKNCYIKYWENILLSGINLCCCSPAETEKAVLTFIMQTELNIEAVETVCLTHWGLDSSSSCCEEESLLLIEYFHVNRDTCWLHNSS